MGFKTEDKNEPDFPVCSKTVISVTLNDFCGGATKQGNSLLSVTKQLKFDLCEGFIQTTAEKVVSPDLWLLWPHDTDQVSVLPAGQEFLPQGPVAVTRSVVTPVRCPYLFSSQYGNTHGVSLGRDNVMYSSGLVEIQSQVY